MNYKRAIGIGLLIFIASLVVCGIAGRLLGVDLKNADPDYIPAAMWLIANVSVIVLLGAGSFWYFKSPEIAANAKKGFALGALYVVFGIILDGAALIPHKNGFNILLRYFTKLQYWSAFALILITCTVAGYLIGKQGAESG